MAGKITAQVDKGPACYENWKASLAGDPVRVEFEYPLYTDAHLIGHDLIDGLGPYRILNCVNVFRKNRPALVLCVQHHLVHDNEVKLHTEDEAYHGGYLQDEIAALTALLLGIRLKAGDPNREIGPDDPRGRPISYGLFHEDPIVPNISQNTIIPNAIGSHQLSDAALLTRLLELKPREVIALMRAARLYQEAIWIVESTPELSWLMLTSAIETTASSWRPTIETHEESLRISRPKLVRLLYEQGGNELVVKVADELAGTIGATRNFIDFILQYLPDPPKSRSYEWAQHRWDRRSMKKSLGLIYEYRSRALHGGKPFPAPMCQVPISVAENSALIEVPPGLASTSRGATWAAKDTPMLLHVYEYIVRNVLINWWRSIVPEAS